jgi:hypothetical protein
MKLFKFGQFLAGVALIPASLWAVTVSLPAGGVDLSAALTWTGTQVFSGAVNLTNKLGLGGTRISTDAGVEVKRTMRVSGSSDGPSTGVGIEMAYIAPDSYMISYNRDSSGYASLIINGAPLQLNPNGAYVSVGGQLGMLSQTSAQVQALVPQAAGYSVYNSTIKMVCFSTGTGTGALVRVTDATACW